MDLCSFPAVAVFLVSAASLVFADFLESAAYLVSAAFLVFCCLPSVFTSPHLQRESEEHVAFKEAMVVSSMLIAPPHLWW